MVHGIGFGDHVPPRVASVGRDRGASARERTNPEDGVAQPQEAAEAASDAPANDSNSGSAQGVLRNLEAGHFSGVADVRIPIDFADQILAAELRAAERATSEAAAHFAAGAEIAVAAFVEAAGELTEEQQSAVERARDAFATALSDAAEAGLSSDDLIAALSGAVDQFIRTLNSIFTPSLVDTVGGGEPTGEVESPETELGPTALVDELAKALAIVLGGLALGTVTSAPSSPRAGSTVAYERFLAQYYELYGEPGGQPAATTSIDIQA